MELWSSPWQPWRTLVYTLVWPRTVTMKWTAMMFHFKCLVSVVTTVRLYYLWSCSNYTEKPYFTRSPSSVGVAETDPAQLQCSGAGLPAPTVTWWKVDSTTSMATQVLPSSGTVISSEYMVILRTTVMDRGYYYCNLSSPVGVVTSPQAYLNVFGKLHDI